MTTIDLVECLWYYWNQKKKSLIGGNDVELWCNQPHDRNNQPIPIVSHDVQRWEAWHASLEAQQQNHVVRWKEGDYRNARVWFSLSQNLCSSAYLDAKSKVGSNWIENQIPPGAP